MSNPMEFISSCVTKGIVKPVNGFFPDRILHMKIVLSHIDLRVAHDALDRCQIDTQCLHLAYISVAAAVGSQNPDSFDFFSGVLKFFAEA